MAVTYLLEVQSSITRRDIGIIKLNTSAGDPPSAVTLLEKFAAIRNRDALPADLSEARNWCATVRQSHTAHPSLIYFRSAATGAGWPAAFGALLDLALFAEHCLDDDRLFGPAVLLREEGLRMARELCRAMAARSSGSSARRRAQQILAQVGATPERRLSDARPTRLCRSGGAWRQLWVWSMPWRTSGAAPRRP